MGVTDMMAAIFLIYGIGGNSDNNGCADCGGQGRQWGNELWKMLKVDCGKQFVIIYMNVVYYKQITGSKQVLPGIGRISPDSI